MKPKFIVKISIDTLMTLAMLFVMGYHLWGEFLHEWVGAGLFALFILHHILNFDFYKSLFKSKFSSQKILRIAVDLAALTTMLGLMISGVMLSAHVFRFLGIRGGTSFARQLHMSVTHWGFLVMALHLGIHWNVFLGLFRKLFKIKNPSKIRSAILKIIALCVCAYGVYAFIKRDFSTPLFLRSQFIFLDYEESKLLFYADYIAIGAACAAVGHYLSRIFTIKKRRKQSEENTFPDSRGSARAIAHGLQ